MMNWLVLVGIIATIVLAAVLLKGKLVKWLHYLRGYMHIENIREAIKGADKDKAETDRKNMVLINRETESFEPYQKKYLKRIANAKKVDDTPKGFRKKKAKKIKPDLKATDVAKLEKKSIYVTN